MIKSISLTDYMMQKMEHKGEPESAEAGKNLTSVAQNAIAQISSDNEMQSKDFYSSARVLSHKNFDGSTQDSIVKEEPLANISENAVDATADSAEEASTGIIAQESCANISSKDILPADHVISGDYLAKQLQELDQMITDKCDFSQIFSKILMILMVQHRLLSRENKIDSLDREIEIKTSIKLIKNTYNTSGALTVTCIAAGLQLTGGVLGIMGAFPGTAVGNGLAKFSPLKSFFEVPAGLNQQQWQKSVSLLSSRFSSLSQGFSSFGNAAGSGAKILGDGAEAERVVHQFSSQTGQSKQQREIEKAKDHHQQQQENRRLLSQIMGELHSLIADLCRSARS